MTDYTDLIARLRSDDPDVWPEAEEAADALEAQAKLIEKLEANAVFWQKDALHTLKVKNEGDARIAALEATLREAYEVYAGSDGFIAETAAEGYLQQLISEMVAIIGAGLKK